MNFQYKATLRVNGRTHLTPYVSNIETTNTLLDLQFCRYNQTPMKVASTKYEVATSIITIFMLKNVYMHQMFLQPPLTQCYFCQFYRNFDQLWIIHKKLDTKTRAPTDPTGSPEHRKNHLDEVQARSGAVTHQEDICVIECFAILYCMAYDV